jgi:tryptophan 2,3-dioxygenase
MELTTTDFGMLESMTDKLRTAGSLTTSLDLSTDAVFSVELKASRKLFPLTFEKYQALRWKKLGTLKPAQMNELQEVLESEIQPILNEARLSVQQTKTIHGEVLPTDPKACYQKLSEIMAAKKQKIKDLQREWEEVDEARQLVDMMKASHDILDHVDTLAKKRKVSAL